MQVVRGPEFRRQAENNRTRLIHLPAARGTLLDRQGIPLVEDRLSFECAALPQELKNPNDTWLRLANVVGFSPEELSARYRRNFQAAFSPVPLVQDLSPQTAFLMEENRWDFPGTMVRPLPRRRYLLGPALGPVAGFVGLIAPEELTKLRPYGYTFRDLVGKEGLEKTYDSYLRGRDGGLHVEVDARGRMVRQLGFLPPKAGKRITVTLDGRLQLFCYRLLEGKRGAIIAMVPSTGEILALVSYPSFDPNAFVDSTRRSEVRHFLHGSDRPMFNRAIRSGVAPGSTFKVAVAYEALKEGKIEPGTAFDCSGIFRLGRALFRCWRKEGHGPQTVREALEHSCNVFFYNTGHRLGVAGIVQVCHLFGLGRPTGIDLPRESKGLVPDPAWMKAARDQPWQEGDTVSFAIGQGPLLVTPLQMLLLFTTLSMDGAVVQPHLVFSIEGERPVTHRPVNRIPLDPTALRVVKEGMEQVVNSETGTGRLAQMPGIRVAGKTGTAQVPVGLAHAWFCGYAPADHPKVSFVVFLEHGGKGGEQAALVARDLLAYLHELGYL